MDLIRSQIRSGGPVDRLRHNLTLVRRVLVVAMDTLGELVMSLPALRTMRAAFEDAELAVLVKDDLASFFDGMGWIDEVIPYAVPRIGLRRKVVNKIRERRFDLAMVLSNSFQSALWVTLAAVPRRVGYATEGRGLMLTHRATPAADALQGHQVHYWLGMLRDTLGIASIPHVQEHMLELDNASLKRARAWLREHNVRSDKPLIAMAPAAAYGPAREWPPVRYSALISWLARTYGAQCVLVGTRSERKKCEQVAAKVHSGAIMAAGDTDIGELKALLSLCDGFVGNDSGAMQLAAAVGIPTVGIFGSTNPAKTGPLGAKASSIYHRIDCSPCFQRTCPYSHYNCLLWVTPHEIADALVSLGAFKTKDNIVPVKRWRDWQREWHEAR
jgi:heptosyltransferase II